LQQPTFVAIFNQRCGAVDMRSLPRSIVMFVTAAISLNFQIRLYMLRKLVPQMVHVTPHTRSRTGFGISRDTVVSRDKFTILYSIASRDGTVSIYVNRRVASTRDYRISITAEPINF